MPRMENVKYAVPFIFISYSYVLWVECKKKKKKKSHLLCWETVSGMQINARFFEPKCTILQARATSCWLCMKALFILKLSAWGQRSLFPEMSKCSIKNCLHFLFTYNTVMCPFEGEQFRAKAFIKCGIVWKLACREISMPPDIVETKPY